MTSLVFATNNQNKVTEIQSIAGPDFKIISLKESGIDIDIHEPHDTLLANASEKSSTIYKLTRQNCFSEDTGLEVNFLNGEPGVKSARYAGEHCNTQHNIEKLLTALKASQDRRARFRTVISLILSGQEFFFEGVCEGHITLATKGDNGFGYDPVFMPDGAMKTFAEMDISEKNKYSHRKKAVGRLMVFLSQSGTKLSH